ncbi:MAG: sigma-70 family RNA polymerase sigma factor [Fuerstiella sp.]|nr:sigma-70 family RNA polymerase sigma factor [Fuerstiella sp.]
MWPEGEKTQQLLHGAKNGDADAVNILIERHRQAVRRLIEMRLDNAVTRRVDASDVVQDVMFEASRRLADYIQNPIIPFHIWLRQLAKDRVIDMHRRHRVAQRRSVDREQHVSSLGHDEESAADLAALLKDKELTPAAATVRKEMEQRFLEALNSLNEDDRELIMMRHFEHLESGEVAAALGLSGPAAGMRYLRAIRRLRTSLGTNEHAD